ncbi:hypothetical protein KEJ15_07920 [Candidatus Bathyarchaeota archaeon]|nr:hypothetical protein [Candidatus Bathyarchaeota archaeon]
MDSTLSLLSVNQESLVSLINSTYTFVNINDNATMLVSWYLDVHVIDSLGQNVSFANVTAYVEYTLIQSKLTDTGGLARLTLQSELVNATGHYPAANYFINASYLAYQSTTEISVSSNLHLDFILEGLVVPEFPANLILHLFIVAVLLAAILYRKRQKQKENSPIG